MVAVMLFSFRGKVVLLFVQYSQRFFVCKAAHMNYCQYFWYRKGMDPSPGDNVLTLKLSVAARMCAY